MYCIPLISYAASVVKFLIAADAEYVCFLVVRGFFYGDSAFLLYIHLLLNSAINE